MSGEDKKRPLIEVFSDILRDGEVTVNDGNCMFSYDLARSLREAGAVNRGAGSVRNALGSSISSFRGVFSWNEERVNSSGESTLPTIGIK